MVLALSEVRGIVEQVCRGKMFWMREARSWWNDASLRWLVDPADGPGAGADSLGAVGVGIGDVDRFRATVELFASLMTGSAAGTLVRC